jgi:hypothetical protein
MNRARPSLFHPDNVIWHAPGRRRYPSAGHLFSRNARNMTAADKLSVYGWMERVMLADLKSEVPGNSYEADDSHNCLNRDDRSESSTIVPWILGGMFAVATLIGLLFGQETPLTEWPTPQVSQNLPTHPAPAPFQSN